MHESIHPSALVPSHAGWAGQPRDVIFLLIKNPDKLKEVNLTN